MWACLGLERLDIVIEGVRRWGVKQERRLYKVVLIYRLKPTAADEAEALERRQNSNVAQRQVYKPLLALHKIPKVDFGSIASSDPGMNHISFISRVRISLIPLVLAIVRSE
jgi:hypothetical protein